ncbi:D-alanine--D-alanine ligase family protein [Ruegeria sp. HKCCD8929]|uniref:D-alanine--D-alanine ligase family protein n=1 Tax=Ruegeria sp. HKCCD8929 TaxID=2683006 RepID=UPI001488D9E9|nr:D-alanine--D-alanine ligase family protein [Ruegeria sp. HKCCD8929]
MTANGDRLRIMILFGGRSAEHEVSILSATNVLEAINQEKFEPVPVYIGRDGIWRPSEFSDGKLSVPTEGACLSPVPGGRGQVLNLSAKGAANGISSVDAIFPVLHGQWGEDGSVPGLATVAQIPLVGCGLLGSANALEKEVAKRLLKEAGVPTARAMTLRPDSPETFEEVRRKLGVPFFLKPATQGSSVGVGKVSTEEDYHTILERGFELDHKMLAEEYIDGREIECGVLENPDGSLIVSCAGEIVPADQHAFYTYDAKYVDEGGAALHVPAELPGSLETKLQSMAAKAFRAVGCDGMARVDFFLKGDGEILVNELNTIPGFTDISMYSKVMEASGISYSTLIDKLIAHGIERFHAEDHLQ